MLDLMEIFSPVFWLWMMNSPGEDAENTLTRDLARSRSGAASIQRRSPPSTLKMSNGGIMAGRCVSNHTGPAMSTPFTHGSQATYLGLRRLSGCKNERQPRRWLRQLGDAEHDAVGVESEGKIVVAENAQAEHSFVEGTRFFGVEGGGKGHEFVRAEHCFLPGEKLREFSQVRGSLTRGRAPCTKTTAGLARLR